MRREFQERFLRHRGLAIPTCITARARRTCRDACRDGDENLPGIPGACANRNFTYLVRDSLSCCNRYCMDRTITGPDFALMLHSVFLGYDPKYIKRNKGMINDECSSRSSGRWHENVLLICFLIGNYVQYMWKIMHTVFTSSIPLSWLLIKECSSFQWSTSAHEDRV